MSSWQEERPRVLEVRDDVVVKASISINGNNVLLGIREFTRKKYGLIPTKIGVALKYPEFLWVSEMLGDVPSSSVNLVNGNRWIGLEPTTDGSVVLSLKYNGEERSKIPLSNGSLRCLKKKAPKYLASLLRLSKERNANIELEKSKSWIDCADTSSDDDEIET